MAQPAIRDPFLEELDQLPASFRRELREFVHTLAAGSRALDGLWESSPDTQTKAHLDKLMRLVKDQLEPRERKILDLVMKGATRSEVAGVLGISRLRVSKDIQRIRELIESLGPDIPDGHAVEKVGMRFAADHPTAGHQGRTGSPRPTAPAPDAPSDDVLDAIRSFLADGRVPEARRLAVEAAARFPDHEGIQAARRILDSDGKPILRSGNGTGTSAEFDWLRDPPRWAHGKWVALMGAEAVACADTLPELVERLASLDLPQKPLVHRID